MAEKSDAKGAQQSLEVFWGKVDALEPIFADNLHLQRVNDQYYLTFGQIRMPTVESPSERVVAEIRPVVKLIVTKGALKRISDLLGRNLKDTE